MSISTCAQAMLASLVAAHPDFAVSVAYAGRTATGIRVTTGRESSPDEMGMSLALPNTVRVSSADLDEPGPNAAIMVGGSQVYVKSAVTTAGIMRIVCSHTRPIEGVI